MKVYFRGVFVAVCLIFGTQAHAQWAAQQPFSYLFGTGMDGNVTISSGTTTLTRDMNYANLTISGTGSLNPNGFRVFVKGTLDLSNAPSGAVLASPGTLGLTTPSGSGLRVSTAGTTGSGAAGTSGYSGGANNYQLLFGGSVGTSGAGGAGTNSGGLGAGTNSVSFNQTYLNFPTTELNRAPAGTGGGGAIYYPVAGFGGASGGAGGGDGTNLGGSGGNGGASGSTVAMFANIIARGTNTNANIIQAEGQSPPNGSSSTAGNTGGGGGGDGGGGGLIDIVAGSFTGSSITNALNVSGGNGGAGGNGQGTGKGGNGGAGGNGGGIQILNLSATGVSIGTVNTADGFSTSPFNTTGTAGSTTSTTTGAAGGAGATVQGNL